MPRSGSTLERVISTIRKQGGTIRSKDAVAKGIQTRMLAEMVENGQLERISRGVYRLPDVEPLLNPDLFTVAIRVPRGVICLISALSFHDLTTQIPREVSLALKKGAEKPKLDYPPVSVHHFSGKTFSEGIEEHLIDSIPVKIYTPEKTLADCFKFRNQIGMDVVVEALKFYRSRKKLNMKDLIYYAKICRVDKVMRPYLEAIV